jgi:hypothetical protein
VAAVREALAAYTSFSVGFRTLDARRLQQARAAQGREQRHWQAWQAGVLRLASETQGG